MPHPVLSREAHVALTLRLVDAGDRPGGPRLRSTVAQRIVRAKRTLTEARDEFLRAADLCEHERDGALVLAADG